MEPIHSRSVSTRAERRAERRKQRRAARAQQARTFPWFTLLVVAVVVVFGFVLLKGIGAFDAPVTGASIDPRQYTPSAGQQVPSMGNDHLKPGQKFTGYNSTPPTSGPHDAQPLPAGVYTTPQPDERVVHSLEHGYVFIGYNGLSEEDLAKLKSIRSRYPRDKFGIVKIIIAPYPSLPQGTIAMTAWGWIEKLTQYDERRIIAFIVAHIDNGPEDAP